MKNIYLFSGKMKPIKIENIKIEEVNFSKRLQKLGNPENEVLKNSLNYIDYLKSGVNAKDLLPKKSKFRVDFVISGTCSGFANGIRKCIMEEIPIYSLHVNPETLESSDRYILSDNIQKNIELIPIIQDKDFEEIKNWKISLDILNSTDEVVNVKSGDLEITADGKKIPVDNIMSPNITIMELHPARFVKISDISIVEGFAKDNAGKFATVSNTRYEILDMVPLAHDVEEKEPGESSMVKDPTEFHLGYTTYRNTKNPQFVIHRCCAVLKERLEAFHKELNEVKENKKTKVMMHFSTLLDVETRSEIRFFNFKNESWTLVNMISQYCYLLDNEIPFVAPSIIHPSTNVGVIKIKHPNPIKIIQDAISAILVDIEILDKSFN